METITVTAAEIGPETAKGPTGETLAQISDHMVRVVREVAEWMADQYAPTMYAGPAAQRAMVAAGFGEASARGIVERAEAIM